MEHSSNNKGSKVVLLLGGNLGDRLSNLEQAEQLLAHKMTLIAASRIFETEAWGGNSQGNYLNRALLMQTPEHPERVLTWAQEIENQLQRVRTHTWGNRTMDIDIIYFGHRIINQKHLTVPHPHLQDRKFVLEPLMDIIPDWVDPRSGLTVQEMNKWCQDTCKVWLYR